jgi:hypothetical protein
MDIRYVSSENISSSAQVEAGQSWKVDVGMNRCQYTTTRNVQVDTEIYQRSKRTNFIFEGFTIYDISSQYGRVDSQTTQHASQLRSSRDGRYYSYSGHGNLNAQRRDHRKRRIFLQRQKDLEDRKFHDTGDKVGGAGVGSAVERNVMGGRLSGAQRSPYRRRRKRCPASDNHYCLSIL